MWKNLDIAPFSGIEKFVAEYIIGVVGILPAIDMKVKIYENQEGVFTGITEVKIKTKFDGSFESAVGYGKTEEIALQDTLRYFYQMIEENYPDRDDTGLLVDEVSFDGF